MRWEVELWGTVLSFSIGPVQYEEPVEHVGERLYLADGTHAGAQEDPVFPNLDWGDDEEVAPRVWPHHAAPKKSPPEKPPSSPRLGFGPV